MEACPGRGAGTPGVASRSQNRLDSSQRGTSGACRAKRGGLPRPERRCSTRARDPAPLLERPRPRSASGGDRSHRDSTRVRAEEQRGVSTSRRRTSSPSPCCGSIAPMLRRRRRTPALRQRASRKQRQWTYRDATLRKVNATHRAGPSRRFEEREGLTATLLRDPRTNEPGARAPA